MESVNKIKEILLSNKYLIFYKIMKYPIPQNMEYFFFKKNIKNNIKDKSYSIDINKSFSRKTKNKNMDEYVNFINRY